MHPRNARGLLLLAAAGLAAAAAVAGEKVDATATTTTATTTTSSTSTGGPTAVVTPCVARSSSGAFYDLRPDMVLSPANGAKPQKGAATEDYFARGHDYGSNFTLNLCAAVAEPVEDVVGLERGAWKDVSAYYTSKGRIYSIGQQSPALITRGRKLVLQYTGGSPCPPPPSYSDNDKRGIFYDDDDDYDLTTTSTSSSTSSTSTKKILETETAAATERRKSTTISFLCDREPANSVAAVSFVSTPDECAYFFEVRSQHACAGLEPHKPGSIGPGSVFAIILLIAVLVYLLGGVMYQRTVAHARGWRQLPNYSLWASVGGFLKDMVVILTSSCLRFLPGRRGYRSLAVSPNGRGRSREDENRLIDQLDEEWED